MAYVWYLLFIIPACWHLFTIVTDIKTITDQHQDTNGIMKYKIINEKVLSKGWGTLQEVTYEKEGHDGKMHQLKTETYDVGNGAAILLYNKEKGTVVLIRQFRLVTVYNGNPEGMLTEVCAGKIDDLSPDETIIKEVKEETGYQISQIEHVMQLYMSPGSFTELLHLYIAPYTPEMKKGEGGGLANEGEMVEVHEMPYTQAMEMVWNGEIKDAKTVLLLQYAGLKGLFDKTADNATTSRH